MPNKPAPLVITDPLLVASCMRACVVPDSFVRLIAEAGTGAFAFECADAEIAGPRFTSALAESTIRVVPQAELAEAAERADWPDHATFRQVWSDGVPTRLVV